MPEPMPLKERTARALIERIEQMGRAMATAMGEPYEAETVGPQRERELFWLADPLVDEQALWAAGKTPKEVSQAVFPHRWEILGAGGRIKIEDKVKWSERMMRLGPPEGAENTANTENTENPAENIANTANAATEPEGGMY